MKKELTAKLHSIETFGAVDGPGIRTVFFLQGCPARCRYCHNPDTWDMNAGAAGVLTAEEAVRKARRCRPYYGPSGGVTFSGGEPLIHGEFLVEAVDALHKEGINCAIDTSGTYFDRKSEEVIEKADLILLDVKHTDPVEFKKLTGRDIDTLFQIMEAVNETETPVWIRQVIVPGLNDTEEYVRGLKEFIRAVNKVEKVELLGYHSMARTKYEKLGISYPLEGVNDMDAARLKELQEIVEDPVQKASVKKR